MTCINGADITKVTATFWIAKHCLRSSEFIVRPSWNSVIFYLIRTILHFKSGAERNVVTSKPKYGIIWRTILLLIMRFCKCQLIFAMGTNVNLFLLWGACGLQMWTYFCLGVHMWCMHITNVNQILPRGAYVWYAYILRLDISDGKCYIMPLQCFEMVLYFM